jgi:hypothetical protein
MSSRWLNEKFWKAGTTRRLVSFLHIRCINRIGKKLKDTYKSDLGATVLVKNLSLWGVWDNWSTAVRYQIFTVISSDIAPYIKGFLGQSSRCENRDNQIFIVQHLAAEVRAIG